MDINEAINHAVRVIELGLLVGGAVVAVAVVLLAYLSNRRAA